VVEHVLAVFLGDLAGDPGQAKNVALQEVQQSGLSSAQSGGIFDDGVEDVLGVGGSAPERREDLAARRGLMAGVP
jgi:hypothetical protein